MNKRYIVALDQGTTSSRAVVFTPEGRVMAAVSQEFKQHYPKPGWVEHDPEDILFSQTESLRAAVRKAGISASEIASIGITNQRETTLVWDKRTGKCVYNAIVCGSAGAPLSLLKNKERRPYGAYSQQDGPCAGCLFFSHKNSMDIETP